MDIRQAIAFGILYDRLTQAAGDRSGIKGWIANGDATKYGSFKWVCEELGIAQDTAKNRLTKLSRTKLRRILNEFSASLDAQVDTQADEE